MMERSSLHLHPWLRPTFRFRSCVSHASRPWLGVMLTAAMVVLGTAVGCPTPQPRLESHHELRLQGLRGENVEDQITAAIAYNRNNDDAQRYHIESLGWLGSGKSMNLLELIVERKKTDHAGVAAKAALERINARNGQRPDLIATRQTYFDGLQATAKDRTRSAFDRMMALKELAAFGAETADRLALSLADWFADEKADVTYRSHAVMLAYDIETPAALDALCAFTGDEKWFIGEVPHIHDYARRYYPDRYQAIWRDSFKQQPELKKGAAFLLGYDGDPSVVDYFQTWLDDPDKDRRNRSLAFLKNIRDPRVSEIAIELLKNTSDKDAHRHALDALDTNYDAKAGADSALFVAIRENWSRLVTERQRQALELLAKHGEFGARDLYFTQAKDAADATVRRVAAQLRVGDAAAKDPARDIELVKNLVRENDDKTALTLIEGYRGMYAETWRENAAVCDALIAFCRRADGRAWAAARASALDALGLWGRFGDAVEIEKLANYAEFTELHGHFAAAQSPGLREFRRHGASHVPVPEFAAVSAILERNRNEFAAQVRGFSRLTGPTRQMALHYFYLADDAEARNVWNDVLRGTPEVQSRDLAFFQPFALNESQWKDMFGLLANAIGSSTPIVTDTAFGVLNGRFLVRQRSGGYTHGENLATVFRHEETQRFVKDLMPVLRKVAESGERRQLEWLTAFIKQGALPAAEVVDLTKILIGSRQVTESIVNDFLGQMQRNVTPETFVDYIVPVALTALDTPWRSSHRRVAQIVDAHFANSARVTSDLTALVRRLVQLDDNETRASGRRAADQMGRWAVQRVRNQEQNARRALIRDAVAALVRDWSRDDNRDVRRIAASLIGQLAPLAGTPAERSSDFFRNVLSIVTGFVTNQRDRDDAPIMRPVAQFIAAMGDLQSTQPNLMTLLANSDPDVRQTALDGLSRRITPALIPDLKTWLGRENNDAVRTRGLELYADAGERARDLEAAIWLESEFRNRRETDLQYSQRILAAWIAATPNAATREQTFLRLCDEKGKDVYALILPALRHVASVRGLPLLNKIVDRDEPRYRALAAAVLARIPDNDDAERLLSRLINDDDAAARMAAISAAGEVGRLSAMGALLKREQRGRELPAAEALALRQAIEKIVRHLHENLTPTEQLQQLVRLSDEAEDVAQKVFFVGELAKVEHDQRVTVLESKMNASEPEVRRAALRAYLAVQGERAIDRLQGVSADRDEQVRAIVVEFLGTQPVARVWTQLEAFLQDSALAIRLAALHALGRDKTEKSLLSVLDRVLTSDDKKDMRIVAARFLKDVRVPGVYETLLTAADDGEADVRVEAMLSLLEQVKDRTSLRVPEQAVFALALKRLDDTPAVQLATLELIGEIGTADVFQGALEKLRERTSEQAVRMKINEVLRALTGE